MRSSKLVVQLLPAAQPMRRAALIAVVLIAAESHTKAVFTEAESPTEAETIAAAAGTPALQPDRCGRRCGCRCCGRRLVLRHHGGYDYGGLLRRRLRQPQPPQPTGDAVSALTARRVGETPRSRELVSELI